MEEQTGELPNIKNTLKKMNIGNLSLDTYGTAKN